MKYPYSLLWNNPKELPYALVVLYLLLTLFMFLIAVILVFVIPALLYIGLDALFAFIRANVPGYVSIPLFIIVTLSFFAYLIKYK